MKKTMQQEDPATYSRLLWRCRRGMLELDLLLQGFLKTGAFDALTMDEKEHFYRVLDYQDQELLECLMGQKEVEDRDIANVINRIRAAA